MSDTTPSDDTLKKQKKVYQGMMDLGMNWGIPAGGATAQFVMLLLIDAGIFVSLVLSFFAFLGLRGIFKTFFSH